MNLRTNLKTFLSLVLAGFLIGYLIVYIVFNYFSIGLILGSVGGVLLFGMIVTILRKRIDK